VSCKRCISNTIRVVTLALYLRAICCWSECGMRPCSLIIFNVRTINSQQKKKKKEKKKMMMMKTMIMMMYTHLTLSIIEAHHDMKRSVAAREFINNPRGSSARCIRNATRDVSRKLTTWFDHVFLRGRRLQAATNVQSSDIIKFTSIPDRLTAWIAL